MDYDVENLVGAARYERNEARTTQRNGFRERNLETRLGTLDLKIPKLRQGSYFPAFLEPRKTAEPALVAVVQRLGFRAFRRARSTIWCRRWACRAFPRARCRSSARTSTSG